MAGNWLIRNGQSKITAFILTLALVLGSFVPVFITTDFVHADGPDGFVRVRIEAGGLGLGADGSPLSGKTVLPETKVPLNSLTTATAINAVNQALGLLGLPAAEEGSFAGFYTAFGGFYSGDTTYWNFMLNDKVASLGLDATEVKKDDSVVLFIKDFISNTPEYAYFVKGSTYFYNEGYLYATADLVLQKNNPAVYDWNPSFDMISPESAEPLGNVDVSVVKDGEIVSEMKTDSENGTVSLSFFDAGTYMVTAAKYENGKASICPAYVEIEVTDSDIFVKTPSSALDTSLRKLDLVFKGTGADDISTSALAYLGGLINAGNLYTEVALSAVASAETGTEEIDDEVTVSLSYKPETSDSFVSGGEFDFKGTSKIIPLEEGENIIKLHVSNGLFDSFTHTLVVVRKTSTDNSDTVISDVINAVKAVPGSPYPGPDWILSMVAAGLKGEISSELKNAFLVKVLADVRNFAGGAYVSRGTLAKYAMALNALNIDPRQIPDIDGNPINLIEFLAVSPVTSLHHAYDMPYMLLLFSMDIFDSEDYEHAGFSADELINAILCKQNESGLWQDYFGYDGIDETAMVIAALAEYYDDNDEVKNAVDKAVAALAERQTLDGGFDSGWGTNSNTASTVIAGLVSQGINPHLDSRYIKNGVSLIDNLLSFKTGNNTLGYQNNSVTDELACIQGFQALATYRNLKSGNGKTSIYDVDEDIFVYTNWPDARLLTGIAVTREPVKKIYSYDSDGSSTIVDTGGMEVRAYYNGKMSDYKILEDGDYTVSTIDTASAGTKQVTVAYQGHTATFNVTVNEQSGAAPQAKTVKITVRSSGKGIIASDNAYPVEPGKTTVLDALKAVLSAAGISYTISGGYVSEIDGLREFEHGANSGWMYFVNGEDPVIAAGLYKLSGGEKVEWKYTLDYTQESGSGKWNQDEDQSEESDLNEAWPFLDVKEGSDNWYYEAVKYVYEKGIFAGTAADKFSPDAPLTRAMLAAVLARMSGVDLTAYEAFYESDSGGIFNDVPARSWYGPAVAWAKEVGIVSGYENKDGSFSFRPDANISRQDIAVMLHNYNEKVGKKNYAKVEAIEFADSDKIPGYAKDAVRVMQETGIISGFPEKDGTYRYRPGDITTRAQAANLLYNMLTK